MLPWHPPPTILHPWPPPSPHVSVTSLPWLPDIKCKSLSRCISHLNQSPASTQPPLLHWNCKSAIISPTWKLSFSARLPYREFAYSPGAGARLNARGLACFCSGKSNTRFAGKMYGSRNSRLRISLAMPLGLNL